MNLFTTLLLVALTDSPQVEVTTITGKTVSGNLTAADQETWVLAGESGNVEVPASQILDARVRTSDEPAETSAPHEVVLRDGSRIGAATIVIKGDALQVTSDVLGELSFPRAALSDLRLAESPSAVDDGWIAMVKKERRQDMLVIQKDNKLDFVEGVVGDVNDKEISFLLNGQNVPVPREKVFGLLFRQTETAATRPAGLIESSIGDRLTFQDLTSDGTSLKLKLTSGAEATVALANTRRIDFSFGKLMWLSALKPRDVKHEFRFIDPAKAYENDRDVWGKPLRLGDRTFPRGVCIRSRTRLRYRLDGDYSRFQALMGIQAGYSGDVRIELSLDGQKVLDQAVVPAAEEPTAIDLDVSDKFVLEILVDFGEVESDIGDHLVLANAKLLR